MNIKKKSIFYSVAILLVILLVFFVIHRNQNDQSNYKTVETISNNEGIENGIHVNTGLIDAEGLPLVIAHCTGCHSGKLITQNRLSKDGWQETIRWMQQTQNLWDLGEDEKIIVAYLAKNYAPSAKGRRDILKDIEWYSLEN